MLKVIIIEDILSQLEERCIEKLYFSIIWRKVVIRELARQACAISKRGRIVNVDNCLYWHKRMFALKIGLATGLLSSLA